MGLSKSSYLLKLTVSIITLKREIKYMLQGTEMQASCHRRRNQKNRTLCHCVKENTTAAIYLILLLNGRPLTSEPQWYKQYSWLLSILLQSIVKSLLKFQYSSKFVFYYSLNLLFKKKYNKFITSMISYSTCVHF